MALQAHEQAPAVQVSVAVAPAALGQWTAETLPPAVGAATSMSSYSASKAALVQFTACAAMEGAPAGVRVNAVVPGMVMTAAVEDYMQHFGDQALRTVQSIPMQRAAQPRELAEAIAFLLSDAASFITGVALPVDGGKSVQLYLPT